MEIKQKALRKPNKKAKKNRLRQQNIIAEKQENKCVEVQAGDEDHFQVSLDVSNTRTSFGIQGWLFYAMQLGYSICYAIMLHNFVTQ